MILVWTDFVFEITIEIIKQKSSSKSKSNKKTEEPMGAIRFSENKKKIKNCVPTMLCKEWIWLANIENHAYWLV